MKKKQSKTKQNKKANKDRKEQGDRNYSERARAKWFCCAFKLGFLQLELALSIILKQKELYESKHVAVECRCLKIWDLLSFLVCSSILVLKMMTSFGNIARTTASISKFIYEK